MTRRLKVDVDLDSGSLVIRTTIMDFREVCTAAAINCYEGIRLGDGNESVSYNKGLLSFIIGMEELIKMRRYPEQYLDPIPLIARSTKERRESVEYAKQERLLLDKIIEEALAVQRKKKED